MNVDDKTFTACFALGTNFKPVGVVKVCKNNECMHNMEDILLRLFYNLLVYRSVPPRTRASLKTPVYLIYLLYCAFFSYI